jgi:hypothetical protein
MSMCDRTIKCWILVGHTAPNVEMRMRQNFRNAGFQEVYETIVTKSCGRIVYGISDRLMQEIPHECESVGIVRWVPTNNFLIRIEI